MRQNLHVSDLDPNVFGRKDDGSGNCLVTLLNQTSNTAPTASVNVANSQAPASVSATLGYAAGTCSTPGQTAGAWTLTDSTSATVGAGTDLAGTITLPDLTGGNNPFTLTYTATDACGTSQEASQVFNTSEAISPTAIPIQFSDDLSQVACTGTEATDVGQFYYPASPTVQASYAALAAEIVSQTTASSVTVSCGDGLLLADGDFTSETAINVVRRTEKEVFSFTGADQTATVPAWASSATAKVWAAGGAGAGFNQVNPASGGGGGYAEGTFEVTGGASLLVVVGEGGYYSGSVAGTPPATYGGGGAGGFDQQNSNDQPGGSGGGLSGIFDNTFDQADAVLIAGGGGGIGWGTSNSTEYGGAGGGASGGTGSSASSRDIDHGTGGTQSAGGTGGNDAAYDVSHWGIDGAALNGGSGGIGDNQGGGGGGGGYFGGGGGRGFDTTNPLGPNEDGHGGGGSGYAAATVSDETLTAATLSATPNQGDVDYVSGVGIGGPRETSGGDGLVVITWSA